MQARIKGVHINVAHFKEHKNVKSLKADERKIFAHLSLEDQEAAHQELFGLIPLLPKEPKEVVPEASPNAQ